MERSPRLGPDFLWHSLRLLGRALLVLWRALKLGSAHTGVLSFIFVVCGVGAGVGTAIGSFFEGLPWEVSAVIFLALLFYGVCVASFEEVRKVEGERDKLKADYEAMTQQPLAPPNEDLRQRSCKLAVELSELVEQWQNGVDVALQPGIMANVQREANGDPDGSLEIRAHGVWLTREYGKRFRGKVPELSDELSQHGCIAPGTRDRFENTPTKPEDIEDIMQRLELVCGSSDEGQVSSIIFE